MTKQLCEVPAGSGLKPILGSNAPTAVELLATIRDRPAARRRRRERFGEVSWVNMFGRRAVLPNTPEMFEQLALNREKAFANEPAWDFHIGVAFRRGVLLMDFDEHRHHRRILQMAFTNDKLNGYMDGMQQMIRERVEAIAPRGGQVRLAHEFKAITLHMALEVFVGEKLPEHEADRITHAFLDCLTGMMAMVRREIPFGKYRRASRGRKVLEEFFHGLIDKKRATRTPDLFSVLCHVETEDGHRFTDEDVVNHMIFVLFAAHDTSTSAIATMAYHMGNEPKWQEAARQESLALPRDLRFGDLKEMGTLDLVLKESLRLNSPVPFLAREALRDTELGGHYIPRGMMVLAETAAIHENPAVWKDPGVFDPERFTTERAEDKVHRFAWAPFGAGVHKCIGMYFAQMEIKTILHHLLHTYAWEVPEGYKWNIVPDSLADPVKGLPMNLSVR